jgi:tetratricopeptide (TPR) repeat protein
MINTISKIGSWLAISMVAACMPIHSPSLIEQREAYRLIDQGTLALRQQLYPEAQASFEVAFELAQIPAALDGLGCVSFALGDMRGAEEWFREANRRDPTYTSALRNLAAVYEARGDIESAEFLLRSAIAADPQDYHARNNLAVLLDSSDKGKKNEAVSEFMKAAATEPTALIKTNIAAITGRNRAEEKYAHKQGN